MTLEFKIKRFNELSLLEMYEILQLRAEVFIVEQNCVYQDLDGKDNKAIHVFGYYNNELAAYARLFQAGDYFDLASIGRVVVSPKFRSMKMGHELMHETINQIHIQFNTTLIEISAQQYLEKFYQSHGFITTSEMYLEDDIPHIRMKRE